MKILLEFVVPDSDFCYFDSLQELKRIQQQCKWLNSNNGYCVLFGLKPTIGADFLSAEKCFDCKELCNKTKNMEKK